MVIVRVFIGCFSLFASSAVRLVGTDKPAIEREDIRMCGCASAGHGVFKDVCHEALSQYSSASRWRRYSSGRAPDAMVSVYCCFAVPK